VPQRHEHLKRAQENEQLAAAMNADIPVCADWAITMLFYSALHYLHGFLAGKNFHPPNHDARDVEIERNGSLAGIYREYRRLKDASRAGRYEIAEFRRIDVDTATARLSRIKAHINL
jgi:hypothetical protein